MANRPRKGFTLVELLVVTGLLGALFALVISSLRPNRASQTRDFAQAIISELLETQTRALINDAGATVLVEPVGPASSADSAIAASVLQGRPLPLVTATTGTTHLLWVNANSGTCRLFPTNADAFDIAQQGYKLRIGQETIAPPPSQQVAFRPQTPWLAIGSASFVSTAEAAVSFSFRLASGESRQNEVWPTPLTTSGTIRSFDVQVARYPARGPQAANAGNLAAIDLRYSGIGDEWVLGNAWSSFQNRGTLGFCYGRDGQIDCVMQQVLQSTRNTQPITPTAPIYLLIAAREDIRADWQRVLSSEDSVWIAIDPRTGRAFGAKNVPQIFTFVGTAPSEVVTNWNGAAAPTDEVSFTAVLRAARVRARLGLGMRN
jgi:prepilin-type N-terminal cleavage/methylation domain-containing protein